jgi:CheY-like chemotaxis protein
MAASDSFDSPVFPEQLSHDNERGVVDEPSDVEQRKNMITQCKEMNTYFHKNMAVESVRAGAEIGKNILVVDDEETIRELLSILLHEEGIIHTAANGLDALSKCACNHFDVIVSDIEMPAMNGIELHMNIKHIYRDGFIFFSGSATSEHLEYAAMNNIPFLNKPEHTLRVHSIVKQQLSRINRDPITR